MELTRIFRFLICAFEFPVAALATTSPDGAPVNRQQFVSGADRRITSSYESYYALSAPRQRSNQLEL
jgi:hypothetical protein